MGRPLPIQTIGLLPAPLAMFIASSVVFSVFTVVIFLCGSHTGIVKSLRGKLEDKKQKTVRLGGENKSRLSSKALLMSKMISWRKVQDGSDEDGVVWKKTIIKGDKCRPIDFSGKILYDADGNLLSD